MVRAAGFGPGATEIPGWMGVTPCTLPTAGAGSVEATSLGGSLPATGRRETYQAEAEHLFRRISGARLYSRKDYRPFLKLYAQTEYNRFNEFALEEVPA